ncbi:dienelactone hydrolase [Calycina marina]|uniref:Dienelactone hydrolase n=1 Tax=Calycina marina TaxID=1763456 RepID=A0A9P7YXJ3_9HELO|nr:dienelactone hydrolase [Calycina marina]
MASNPPSTCCTVGVKHEGETTGTTFKIGSIEAYVAVPKDKAHKNTAILYLPDVFGIWENSKLIADQFAANGYYTLVVDLFNGDALTLNRPEGFDFMKWLTKGSDGNNPHTFEAVDPIVEMSIEYLKGEGYTKIGSVGYCFGAKYVARYMAMSKGIDVGYMAHPSFVTEEELSAITGPLSIAAAETDQIFTTELRHKSEEILIKTKLPYQINLFGGTEHGFSVRCNLSIPVQKFAKEKAFLQAVAWFDEYLL